jgi:hypothetical protein
MQQLQLQQSDLLGQQVLIMEALQSLTIKFTMIKELVVALYYLQQVLLQLITRQQLL